MDNPERPIIDGVLLTVFSISWKHEIT